MLYSAMQSEVTKELHMMDKKAVGKKENGHCWINWQDWGKGVDEATTCSWLWRGRLWLGPGQDYKPGISLRKKYINKIMTKI